MSVHAGVLRFQPGISHFIADKTEQLRLREQKQLYKELAVFTQKLWLTHLSAGLP